MSSSSYYYIIDKYNGQWEDVHGEFTDETLLKRDRQIRENSFFISASYSIRTREKRKKISSEKKK